MGGRGGAPRTNLDVAIAQAAARAQASTENSSLAINPEREFREWLSNPRDISADVVGDIDGHPKYSIILPDRDATIAWDGSEYFLRDTHTDERIGTFRGQSARPILRQISKYYGRRVEHADMHGNVGFYGENAPDVRKTAAARKYGIS